MFNREMGITIVMVTHEPEMARFARRVVHFMDGLVASDIEMDSDGPSYTSLTLDRLTARGEDPSNMFLITGADAFREIETWMRYPQLLDRCHFVVVSRPGSPAPALRDMLPRSF